MPLNGRHALITGSSRGIGRGIALKLAEQGVKVAVHYHRNQEAAADTLARSSVVYSAATASMSKPRVLIVDDEKNILSSLSRALDLEGYEPLVAGSAELAREKLAAEYHELCDTIERLRAILRSEELLKKVIVSELTEIRERYGDERRTVVVDCGTFAHADPWMSFVAQLRPLFAVPRMDDRWAVIEALPFAILHVEYLERGPTELARALAAVRKVLLENLQAEERLDAEARQILQEHTKAIKESAVDYGRLLSMIKGKLAKERGFIL